MAAKIKPRRAPMKRPINRVATVSSFFSGPDRPKLGEEMSSLLFPKVAYLDIKEISTTTYSAVNKNFFLERLNLWEI